MKGSITVQWTVRLAALILVFAVLLTVSGERARANQSGPTVNESSLFQQRTCELGGGTATVDPDRTVGEGLRGVWVTCRGGLFNGMHCSNVVNRLPFCFWEAPPPGNESVNDLPVIETVPVTADPGSSDENEVTQDVVPVVDGTTDPVDEQPVDPLPSVVDESPLDTTVPDIDIDQANDGGAEQVDPGQISGDVPDFGLVEEPTEESTPLPQLETVPLEPVIIEAAP